MNTKVDEGKLISGKEALIALANGEIVETRKKDDLMWSSVGFFAVNVFKDENWLFRIAPRTILINGIEAPSIKKESAIYRSNDTVAIVCESFEEAELMCLALRQVFGGSHDN